MGKYLKNQYEFSTFYNEKLCEYPFVPLRFRLSPAEFTRLIRIWYGSVTWKLGEKWNVNFIVFYLQFINSYEVLESYFLLQL